MDIPPTRAIVKAILTGQIKDEDCRVDPVFKVMVPKSIEGVDSELLNPENLWDNKDEYKKALNELAQKFNNNFEKYLDKNNNLSNKDREQMEKLKKVGPEESVAAA
jgi:phosphoenolpyruvate carboxykinase (ATP)